MFQAIAEIAKEVAATAEEIQLSEAAIQDIENLLSQISEAESSVSELSSAESVQQLEANSTYIKDGQLYVTDENGIIESIDGKNETEATKDVVSDVELFTDPQKRLDQALGSNGEWLGEPGKSEFIPNDSAARQAMKECGVESIRYDEHCEPDFSSVSPESVEIDNMTGERYGLDGNFAQAYEKLAEQWNSKAKDGKTDWNAVDAKLWTKENKLTPHERLDRKTVDFVPEDIHKECKHYGGCAECNKRDNIGGGFDA